MKDPKIIDQLGTIEWTREFLKWLPEQYKWNILEAMNFLEINPMLDKPNMTSEDIKNKKLAFDKVKVWGGDNNRLKVNINKTIYHPDWIEIDGIVFDRNNLSWWSGIFNEQTQERYYNEESMLQTLKEQKIETFDCDDIYRLLNWNWLVHRTSEVNSPLNGLLSIMLWCKKTWYIDSQGNLKGINEVWWLRIKPEKGLHPIYRFWIMWSWWEPEWTEQGKLKQELNKNIYFPVRPVIRYNSDVMEERWWISFYDLEYEIKYPDINNEIIKI